MKPEAPADFTPFELPDGRFSGPRAFAQHIAEALACAADEGWKTLVLCDFNFEDWPLNTLQVHEALNQWARPGRRLVLLAVRYDEMLRRHPRFVSWRRRWDHLLDCRLGRAAGADDFPSAVLGPRWFMHRIDRPRSVHLCGQGAEQLLALRESLDQRIRESVPGFPASTLGL